ncbi:MAG: carboxylating nicotinate-nucleotide diphosphorylase [Candidatus Cloacimonetes bacterium]|nr:carboxylating nicotinate-nucleotide diphosphorylase [Candidatus Cloacimonadota bacterium]
MKKRKVRKIIESALQEDFHDVGDVTSEAIFANEEDSFVLLSKADGILCGKEIFLETFHIIDNNCNIEFHFTDGSKITNGDVIASIDGSISSILKAERTALNFISHMSGIATKTGNFVREAGDRCRILDTRKTIPGLRKLEKYAVRCGGGQNHRMGLYDMVMIKDNHIDSAGNIEKAVGKIREKWGSKFKIEVETRNLEEVKQALISEADRVMLDNMSLDMMKEAVKMIAGKSKVEASGNMTLQRIQSVAATGVDFISVGELTHSVKAFDFSLQKKKK